MVMSATWLARLADWFPLLLLIAVWFFFMWMMMRKNSPAKQSLAEWRRHNDVLEKLFAQHDARLRKLEERGGR